MAAAAVSAGTIDLRARASYPVRVGSSIRKSGQSKRYVSVRYNHKPRLRARDATCQLEWSGQEHGVSRLSLRDEGSKGGAWTYAGEDVGHGDNYVLVLRGDGAHTEAVLEKLSGNHAFNLIGTPNGDQEEALRDRYEQISATDGGGRSGEDDRFGEEGGDDETLLDPDNPFDYRHFLQAAAAERAKGPGAETPKSTATTPRRPLQKATSTSTSRSRPTKHSAAPLDVPSKKRKAPASAAIAEKTNSKRVKASKGAESAPQAAAEAPKAKAPASVPPKIRVDRKASIRRPSYDSGELILENETPVTEKQPSSRKSLSLALAGQFGPISLRSAANSPASHMASPAPARPDGMDEDAEPEEFDLGSRSPDDEAGHSDEDADVENLELPSPAQARPVQRPNVGAATVAGDDDDLDAQLAAAMAEADVPAAVDEEEEESEEE